MSAKPYVTVGDVCEQLDIGRSQLQNLAPRIPHLAFYVSREATSTRQTRLFPATYIAALAAYLRQSGVTATIATAKAFSQTTVARERLKEAQESLEAAISARAEHTPVHIAEMFGVARATVQGWERARVFHVERRGHKPKRRRNDGIQERHYIPASEVRQAANWVIPLRPGQYR